MWKKESLKTRVKLMPAMGAVFTPHVSEAMKGMKSSRVPGASMIDVDISRVDLVSD